MPFMPDTTSWQVQDAMAPPPALARGDVHLWLLSLDQPAWPAQAIADCLDRQEMERAARFHFDEHRRRFIAGRGQLRLLLAGYLEVAPRDVRFRYGEQGKPFLDPCHDGPGGRARLHFNLSHSESAALLGVTGDAEIGVDIEAVRAMLDAGDVARDNFSPPEVGVWERLTEEVRQDGFFACWSRKEAVVKAMGGGLSIPLDSFQVTLDPDAPARLLSIDGEPAAPQRWTLWGERVMPGYWGAVAAKAPALEIRRFCLPR